MAVVRTGVSEELNYSETPVLYRAIRRGIPEDGILHSHRRENLRTYITLLNTQFCISMKILGKQMNTWYKSYC
jgi:hypothetical protein